MAREGYGSRPGVFAWIRISFQISLVPDADPVLGFWIQNPRRKSLQKLLQK